MKHFKAYLEKKKYVTKTIKYLLSTAQYYLTWLESKNLTLPEATYQDLLNYIGYLQDQKKSNALINEYLRGIRHYYDYLKLPNLALSVRLLGETTTIKPLFKEEKLEKIYHDYVKTSPKVNVLLLGLTLYQALDHAAIYELHTTDLDLNQAILCVDTPIKKRNPRKIPLHPHQVIPFYEHLQQIAYFSSPKLFPEICRTRSKLRDQLRSILRQLQSQDKTIINLNQLKQSRYAIWIKQYGVRKAQYLGGFKQPSAIQRYRHQDLEDLKNSIYKYHPLQ